jgi:hypothetical protein
MAFTNGYNKQDNSRLIEILSNEHVANGVAAASAADCAGVPPVSAVFAKSERVMRRVQEVHIRSLTTWWMRCACLLFTFTAWALSGVAISQLKVRR